MTTRRRARTTAGRFQGDDPATPLVNEAWVTEADIPPAPEPVIDHDHALAVAAMEVHLGVNLPATLPRDHALSVEMLAHAIARFYLRDTPPGDIKIPMTVRHFWRANPL